MNTHCVCSIALANHTPVRMVQSMMTEGGGFYFDTVSFPASVPMLQRTLLFEWEKLHHGHMFRSAKPHAHLYDTVHNYGRKSKWKTVTVEWEKAHHQHIATIVPDFSPALWYGFIGADAAYVWNSASVFVVCNVTRGKIRLLMNF